MNKWIAIVFALALSSLAIHAQARGHSSGGLPSYGGGKHTTSHGGHYQGGSGSSHRSGPYKNTNTGDQYGRHK